MAVHEGTRLGARLAQAKRWKNRNLEREAATDLANYHIRSALDKVYEHLTKAGFRADLVDEICDDVEKLTEQLLGALPQANGTANRVNAQNRLARNE